MNSNIALSIIGSGAGSAKRNDHDFYPTPPDCTRALINNFGYLLNEGAVWEPACGNGAISRVIEASGRAVVSTDLNDQGFGTSGTDFLQAELPAGVGSIVTNPPFKLAPDFITTSRKHNIPFAMLLKSTFWHAKKRASLFQQTGPYAVCPMTWRPNFDASRGKSATMDFLWTIWLEEPCTRTLYIPLLCPAGK